MSRFVRVDDYTFHSCSCSGEGEGQTLDPVDVWWDCSGLTKLKVAHDNKFVSIIVLPPDCYLRSEKSPSLGNMLNSF